MQNLLPMRRVFIGASTPVFDGETATGLANIFEDVPTGAAKDSSTGLPSLPWSLISLSTAVFTSCVWLWI